MEMVIKTSYIENLNWKIIIQSDSTKTTISHSINNKFN